MSNEENANGHESEIDHDINPSNEAEQIDQNAPQNPSDFFKVTPDDYTDSDSNTIIDFEEEEELKSQNEPKELNENLKENEEENKEEKNETTSKKEEKKENNEEQGEEQENEDEEENEITEPNVKKLMKMDLADKEGIIDLLMKDTLVKKSQEKKEKIIKSKNKAKFDYIESKFGKVEIGNAKSTYGRKGFYLEQEEGNPEFIKDIKIAASVVKDQLEKENNDVAKILFNEKIGKQVAKRVTREQIDEKVKKTLERKKKNLEKIEAQMYEKQKNEETFAPMINHRKGDIVKKRNFNKFLKDQNNFTKKIAKKREEILNEKTEKNKKNNSGKPQVDKNSEELAKKINNTEQPAYLRLYNKRTLEIEKREEREKLIKEKKKAENEKRKKNY